MDKYGLRDVMRDPPCSEQDLGHPLPDSDYAVSVSLPRWKHVIGYEEGDPSVLERLRTGYPRFFVPRIVRHLEKTCLKDFGAASGERCKIFPDELNGKAQRGGSFLCNPNYCHGFRLSARSATSPESSLFHVGFRCVKNITN